MNEAEKRLGVLGINDALHEEEIQKLKEEVDNLKKKLRAAKGQITRLKKEKSELQDEIDTLRVDTERDKETNEDKDFRDWVRKIDRAYWEEFPDHVQPNLKDKVVWYVANRYPESRKNVHNDDHFKNFLDYMADDDTPIEAKRAASAVLTKMLVEDQ